MKRNHKEIKSNSNENPAAGESAEDNQNFDKELLANDPDQNADTDVEDDEDDEVIAKPKLFRLSSRIASLKRRGKFIAPKLADVEFDYYADDTLSVRGPGKDFWVARVLEDVPVNTKSLNVAWYDLVKGEKNKYKISYDDTIHKNSILTRVRLLKDDDNDVVYHLSLKSLKETRIALKESLQKDGIRIRINNSDLIGVEEEDENDDENDDSEDNEEEEESRRKKIAIFDFPSDPDSEDEPLVKKRKTPVKKKSAIKQTSPQKRKTPFKEKTPKKATKEKATPKRRKGLIPNPDIKLLDDDPLFGVENKIPLTSSKQGIRTVLLENTKELERLVKDTKNIYTLHSARSPHIFDGPFEYAVKKENSRIVQILTNYSKKLSTLNEKDRCKPPQISLEEKDSGSYDFYTFGHPVREITVSRGNKEGNNALLYDQNDNYSYDTILKYALKNNVSFEFIKEAVWPVVRLNNSHYNDHHFPTSLMEDFYIVIKYGNYQLAEKIMEIVTKLDGSGFNFLHREVLNSENQPLSSFRSPSVTKKPQVVKYVFPLHCACVNPNVSYIKQLLAVLPEYNTPSWDGSLPVHYAAACEGDGPLKFLLSRGADPTLRDRQLTDPLMIAAKYGRVHNIHVLMKCTISEENEEGEEISSRPQININNKSRKGLTCLHYAAKRGHLEAVKALLDHGALIDIQATASKDNVTPLASACSKGRYDVVKLLLERGALADKKMRRKKTPLMFACMNGHSQIVAHLLHIGVDPNALDTSDNTPLHYAVAYGWYHCVQLLLEGGSDASKPNNWKTTPLEVAIRKNHVEISDLIMNADVDVNYPDEKGRTLLVTQMLQSYTDNTLKIVKFLINEKKADVKKQDINGWNALHYLASHSVYEVQSYWTGIEFRQDKSDYCVKLARMLIEAGLDVNTLSNDGTSPLMIAIRQNNFELVDVLLKNGSKPSIGCFEKNKETALMIAIDGMTKQPGDKIDTMFKENLALTTPKANLQQLRKYQLEVITKLLSHQADVNHATDNGLTPLMKSFIVGNEILSCLLLDHGANPLLGLLNETEQNSLHVLAQNCHKFPAKNIITKMSDKFTFPDEFINAVDDNGMTALHCACVEFLKNYSISTTELSTEQKNISTFIFTLLQKFSNVDVTKQIEKLKIKPEKVTTHLSADSTFNSSRKARKRARVRPTVSIFYNNNNGGLFGTDSEDDDDDDDVCDKNSTKLPDGCEKILFNEDQLELRKSTNPFKIYGPFGLYNAFHLLALQNNRVPDVMKVMFEKVCNKPDVLNQVDRYGRTPMHICIKKMKNLDNNTLKGFNEILDMLIQYGGDVSLPSANKESDFLAPPLCLTARTPSSLYALKSLLSSKVDVNQVDNHKRTALSYVVENDNQQLSLAAVKILVSYGCNLNLVDEDGMSCLHYAVNTTSGGYESLTELEDYLIEQGAKRDIVDAYGCLPIHYAFTKMGSKEVASQIDPISIVKCLCDFKDDEKDLKNLYGDIDDLTERIGKYVNHTDIDKRSVLHHAALRGSTLSCLHLKNLGACDSLMDKDGNTPLALALRGGHNGCAMMLLQQGSKANNDVITPVALSEIEKFENEFEKLKWCFENKLVKPETQIKSAFQVAIEREWQGVAYLMLEYADLPFLDAFVAALKAKKLTLLYTLLRQQRNPTIFQQENKDRQNLVHILTSYCTNDAAESQTLPAHEEANDDDDDNDNDDDDDESTMDVDMEDEDYVPENNSENVESQELSTPEYSSQSLETTLSDVSQQPQQQINNDLMDTSDDMHAVDETSKKGYLELLLLYMWRSTGEKVPSKVVGDKVQIGKFLVKQLVTINKLDEFGCLPLHYACQQNHWSLIDYFLRIHPDHINRADIKGRTPLVYVIESIKKDGACTTHQHDLLRYLVDKGASLDIVYETYQGYSTHILNEVIQLEYDGLLKAEKKNKLWIENSWLAKKFDVNLVTKTGVCALMTVIKLNFESMFNVLMRRKPNVNVTDDDGNSLLHYCVQSLEYGSYENVNLLKRLIRAGASVNLKNKKNESLLTLASKQASRAMEKTLLELGVKPDTESSKEGNEEEFGFDFTQNEEDFKSVFDLHLESDAENEIALKIKDVVSTDDKVKVDPVLKLEDNGEVYIDGETSIACDVTLTKVDVAYVGYGMYLFYKLQVVHNKGLNLWILLNRWGRIGSQGQHQQTPYSTPEEAVFEFKKIFKAKTGNDWNKLDEFEKKPKKYALVKFEKNPERILKHHGKLLNKFDMENDSDMESKLPTELKVLMKSITKISEIQDMNRSSGLLEENLMPLGMISHESIEAAHKILQQIKEILEGPKMSAGANLSTLNDPDVIANYDKISELSNAFFMLLPPTRYSFDKVEPFMNTNSIFLHETKIQQIIHLNFAMKMLLAAKNKCKAIHPYDYCYNALNCRIELLDYRSAEANLIMKTIHNQGYSDRVLKGIYRVQRSDNDNNFQHGMENRTMLWHGTNRCHLLSILHNGLMKKPLHAHTTGQIHGEGIYFSPSIMKASQYADGRGTKFILLCDVAMGNIKEQIVDNHFYNRWNMSTNNDDDEAFSTTDYNSKFIHSKDVTLKTLHDVITPYGSRMNVGKTKDSDGNSMDSAEVVIYEENQIRIRYLLRF